jgi:hypothetical protein
MRIIRFNLTCVEDMHKLDLFEHLEELFNLWHQLIQENCIIVLFRDFTNAPSEEVDQIATQRELDQFMDKFLLAE